jgi:1-aminocyclopropane-1-carboxylate deaminase/D-cysteine desulfhydrase-like pyridoxal-dependent ACC family enzyme
MEFFLIILVGNCKYKLLEFSIGMILLVSIGGVAADFKPQQISNHIFKFVVASKRVGLHIYNLRSFSCEQYKINFNLQRNGGADWVLESTKYALEEAAQWTTVINMKNQRNRYVDDQIWQG